MPTPHTHYSPPKYRTLIQHITKLYNYEIYKLNKTTTHKKNISVLYISITLLKYEKELSTS